MNIEQDKQFREAKISKSEPSKDGWVITDSEGWSILVTNSQCQDDPKPGESVRMYGRGIGSTVRGIVIGGRVYRYQTPADHEIEQEEMRVRLKREREESDAAFRASSKPPLAKFNVRDAEGWDECVKNNDDPYGFRIVQYSADWASLMERDMANGATVPECAERTSREADTDGITGFMYGAAVSILSQAWKHGEALRRWHNKETQIGTEGERANESGGVLNPALLSIGGQ